MLEIQFIEYNAKNDANNTMHRIQNIEYNAMYKIKSLGYTEILVKYLSQLRRDLAIFFLNKIIFSTKIFFRPKPKKNSDQKYVRPNSFSNQPNWL